MEVMEYMFETERLRIRKFVSKDARRLYENHLEEEVKKWIPIGGIVYTKDKKTYAKDAVI